MSKLNGWKTACAVSVLGPVAAVLVIGTVVAQSAPAQTYTESVLYSFAGGTDGANPVAGVIRDAAGNLYGTTYVGGTYTYGTVFLLTPGGKESVLHTFSGGDGAFPAGGLLRDAAGNLYGTTYAGGPSNLGTVFSLNTAGKETLLHNFNPSEGAGGYPYGDLVRDPAGNLYGTASQGGVSGGGTVFTVETGSEGLHYYYYSFRTSNGDQPRAGLVRDSAGNVYGTTWYGGTSSNCFGGCGTVFEGDKTGNKETVLHSFTGTPDGQNPSAALTRDSAGNLYGTTYYGGTSSNCIEGCGTVFKVTPTGTESVLYRFTGQSDGAHPAAGLIWDAVGNLYGTTSSGGNTSCTPPYGCGTVFTIGPAGAETVLYTFSGDADGAVPLAGLIEDAAGSLYGTTLGGGASGYGTVFELKP